MKINNSTTLAALLALILLHILTFSSPSLCNEVITTTSTDQKPLPRRLLLLPSASSRSHSRLPSPANAAVKGPKKAVEQSLRKAPPSVSNPIQNK
ncbi:hypothetical protein MANES_08G045700v8 [Manihot esculenta]|uniref:Uncharacterized protein n=1 Tax=Manihot esculenta TaxID=3983 RepID=A0A2C9VDE0_MANES|nr:hypothetical protein MANES_08G045700v8 [Manihot esculenta]